MFFGPQALFGRSGATALRPQDVFSTTLYTGAGGDITLNTGVNLAAGGLLWVKKRNTTGNHYLMDSERGVARELYSDSTAAQALTGSVNNFTAAGAYLLNGVLTSSGGTYAAWSFRRAPKFFDVVTWTGNGAVSRSFSHALGVTPGIYFVKRTDSTGDWAANGSIIGGGTNVIFLNTTAAKTSGTGHFVGGDADSTSFGVGTQLNLSGATYVAYLFAHDTAAGGVVQCGSFTATGGATASVTLGWRPQFVMFKRSDGADDWFMLDTTRGLSTGADAYLRANTTQAEASFDVGDTTSTGFTLTTGLLAASAQYVYLAIRAPI